MWSILPHFRRRCIAYLQMCSFSYHIDGLENIHLSVTCYMTPIVPWSETHYHWSSSSTIILRLSEDLCWRSWFLVSMLLLNSSVYFISDSCLFVFVTYLSNLSSLRFLLPGSCMTKLFCTFGGSLAFGLSLRATLKPRFVGWVPYLYFVLGG